MVEETTTQETPVENTAADAPEQKASDTNNTKETQTEGLLPEDKTEEKGNAPIPEGFDEEIFDAETRTLKEDKVLERLKSNTEEIGRWKKQANDMRRKLSKGVEAPDRIEDYAEGYMPDERFDYALSDENSDIYKHIKGVHEVLDKFAFDHGMSKETCKDLKDLFNEYAEKDIKIIDTRTQEQVEEDNKKHIAEQKAILGDEAEQILRSNAKFAKEYAMWSDDEKKWLLGQLNTSGVANKFFNKVRKLFDNGTSEDIPVHGGVVSGIEDDRTLAREYYDTKTTDTRRMQILQMRIDAGRTGNLPMPE